MRSRICRRLDGGEKASLQLIDGQRNLTCGKTLHGKVHWQLEALQRAPVPDARRSTMIRALKVRGCWLILGHHDGGRATARANRNRTGAGEWGSRPVSQEFVGLWSPATEAGPD